MRIKDAAKENVEKVPSDNRRHAYEAWSKRAVYKKEEGKKGQGGVLFPCWRCEGIFFFKVRPFFPLLADRTTLACIYYNVVLRDAQA